MPTRQTLDAATGLFSPSLFIANFINAGLDVKVFLPAFRNPKSAIHDRSPNLSF
jgi:hypothetical protein